MQIERHEIRLDFREKCIFFESGEVLELRLPREVDMSTLAVFKPSWTWP